MQKELYQIERSEVSLNISEGAVTEVRRKHIVRSGCRVYDGGKLGISGVFGEPDEATWQAAQRALTAGLSHPEPLGALVRSRETGVMPEERELLEQSEALLAHLREECPGFVFPIRSWRFPSGCGWKMTSAAGSTTGRAVRS